MKSFIEYITESDTSGAFEMEAALVAAATILASALPAKFNPPFFAILFYFFKVNVY